MDDAELVLAQLAGLLQQHPRWKDEYRLYFIPKWCVTTRFLFDGSIGTVVAYTDLEAVEYLKNGVPWRCGVLPTA